MNGPHKVCPDCNYLVAIDADKCGICGHRFTTRFNPPPLVGVSPSTQAFAPIPPASAPTKSPAKTVLLVMLGIVGVSVLLFVGAIVYVMLTYNNIFRQSVGN